ncbi:TPA: NUDIX hydrolase [Legionella pneumophila]|uniref:Mutator MutT protein n=1 Tax=Legionella pneumophila subsp. pneumophila TaxID=91891 RepID=A0AAV2UZT4_LEGPN|nr:NUDIX hydrolase [Legionella pneumophila]MCK1849568.1 NUDIX hydrolase [Legionella pneumophila]MCZ4804173.1 NUDIX hydrolase [Legionella pneumophila]MDI9850566.1 NUDIX hydrolase [Legionella pneumophila]MDW8853701.1 NUDIX hydrolase [Legionella pneumophila]MDW8867007.1 NUDIX hydrolase [Legionella pneumophila]
MSTLKTIFKIGALIFNEKNQLLAVHKKGKPPMELIVPGGVMEENESDEETLRREIKEELDSDIISFQFYKQFEDKAIYEEKWLVMRTYIVTLGNAPKPANEIDQLVWLGHDYHQRGYRFGSILGKQIIPDFFK